MDSAVSFLILVLREKFFYRLARFKKLLQTAFAFVLGVFVRLVEPLAGSGQVRDYVAKRKLWACRLGALNSGNNRNKADFGINDCLHNFAYPRRIFTPEWTGKRRIRYTLDMFLAPTPRFAPVCGSPSVFKNIPKKLHLVSNQPQNCDSLKTISELKPIDLNSASLSATVFGYIQPRRAFALFMICSELKPFFAFISQ